LTALKLARNANNAGIGNKLVTIFARHHDNFAMTINFSLICQFFSGSGQIRNAGPNYPSSGLAKIAPWWLAAGTVYRLKYSMTLRRAAPPTLTAHTSGPLAHIFAAERLSPSRRFNNVSLDKIISALYRDLPSRL
jgi:hypothetical protein